MYCLKYRQRYTYPYLEARNWENENRKTVVIYRIIFKKNYTFQVATFRSTGYAINNSEKSRQQQPG